MSPLRSLRHAAWSISETFRPLRVPAVRSYIGGQAISRIGTLMQVTAQAWVVWELTKSPAALGIVGFLANIPTLLLGSLGGVVADRCSRRKVLFWTQSVAMAGACALGYLVQSGRVTIWDVYAISLILGIANAIELPAHQAFLGDVNGMDRAGVRQTITLNSIGTQGSRMIGPAIAGWLMGLVGAGPVFWVNGVSFLAVIGSLLTIRTTQAPPSAPKHPMTEIRDGFRAFWAEPRFMDLLVLSSLNTLLGWSNHRMLPAIAEVVLHGDARTLGALLTATGVGSLIGALLLAPVFQKFRRSDLMLTGCIAWTGAWFVVFASSDSLGLSLLALVMETMPYAVVTTMTSTVLQTAAAPALRARVLGVWMTVSLGLAPIAEALIGGFAERFGAPAVMRVNGLLMVAIALGYGLVRPGFRRWNALRFMRTEADRWAALGTAEAAGARQAA